MISGDGTGRCGSGGGTGCVDSAPIGANTSKGAGTPSGARNVYLFCMEIVVCYAVSREALRNRGAPTLCVCGGVG